METSLRYAIHMIMAAQLCSVKRKGTQVRDLSRPGKVVVVVGNCCCVALATARDGAGRRVAQVRSGMQLDHRAWGAVFFLSSRLLFVVLFVHRRSFSRCFFLLLSSLPSVRLSAMCCACARIIGTFLDGIHVDSVDCLTCLSNTAELYIVRSNASTAGLLQYEY